MSGEVVGTMSVYEAKVGADEYHFSGAIPPGKYALVLATDYAALQAKLDAVTNDAGALREALKIAGGYMVEYAGLCKVTGFGKMIPRITESAGRIAALTDQGRAGEGRSDG